MIVELGTAPARAETPTSDEPKPETFAYVQPAEKTYVRAVLEWQGVIVLGSLWYLTMTNLQEDWDVGYRWSFFRKKLEGTTFGHDDNPFSTNFVGHPVGGTGYYIAARANRLGILESFGFAIAGSLFWEYFGEVRERVSANDTVLTPIAGLAIGEPLTQLHTFFDRSGPSTLNRTLGGLLGPIKTLNDRFDGLEPARAAHGFPTNEWHDLEAGFSFATVSERSAAGPELRARLAERLARIPGYDGAADHSGWFAGGELSHMTVEGAMAENGLSDFLFETELVLAGHFARRARYAPSGLRGSGMMTGVTVGFMYSAHDYRRQEPGPLDRVAGIRPLGVVFEYRGAHGPVRLTSHVRAGVDYGGVRPYAMPAFAGDQNLFPRPLREHGYYFAAGGHVSSGLELSAGSFFAGASLHGDAFAGVDERLHVPIHDSRSQYRARLGYRLTPSPLSLQGFVERRRRSGSIGSAHAEDGELAGGLGLFANF